VKEVHLTRWLQGYKIVSQSGAYGKGLVAAMGTVNEFMRFAKLGAEPPLIDGHARRTGRAQLRMIRKRRCAAVGQEQMIVVQYPESFEAGSTARAGSCTPWSRITSLLWLCRERGHALGRKDVQI